MSDNEIAQDVLPENLTLLPISGYPIFPGIFTPLTVRNSDDIKIVEKVFENDALLGVVMLKNDNKEEFSINDLFKIGTVVRIIKKINLPDGGINIFISTLKRFRIKSEISAQNPIIASVEYLDDKEDLKDKETRALMRCLISETKQISNNNPLLSDEMIMHMVNIEQPGRLADFIASNLDVDRFEQQRILETLDVRKRMESVLVFIKHEKEILRIKDEVSNRITQKSEANQRKAYLREEMQTIREELGDDSGFGNPEYKKISEKLAQFNFSGEVKEVVERELDKFQFMNPDSSEYIVTRNYLETISLLPWKTEESQFYSIQQAKKILDSAHYGLEDVKKRILEYLAVRKIKGDDKGSIILLVGPPGVGKTSVGKSIAQAMNRPFFRFSVGGLRDESEIKGHRRTYVGAMPGKIIQGLKITKSNKPVFLIDEVDKMSTSYQGDPASALLEVLDPEQNYFFRDQYLDLPFDLSNILFVLTANSLDNIPEPLLDRAEIISLSGYIDQEKIEIAKKYLIPKILEKNGLQKNQVKFDKKALDFIVSSYARESGVRNLEKCLDKICRRYCAELLFQSETEGKSEILSNKITITPDEVLKYLEKPLFSEDEILVADKKGTALGLAWTSMGGDTLLIEAISMPGKGNLQVTGRLGSVMKESSSIAYSWAKQYAIKNKIKKSEWFDKNVIHLHFPEGATPKDGPSAGITITTALISLLTGKVIKKHFAMTGELSLTGRVLPIGGLREKTVAAKRNKVTNIIIPKANEKDLDKIPDNVKKGLTFYPVSTMGEVLKLIF